MLSLRLAVACRTTSQLRLPFGSLLAFADRVNNPYRAAYEGATFGEMLKGLGDGHRPRRFWEAG